MEEKLAQQPIKNVYDILRITYTVVPVAAGADKFTDLLTNWDSYLNPALASHLPFSPHIFMMIVGVVEILAGIIVYIRPSIGALIVTLWLILIAFTLILSGNYLDVAVRDIVMAAGAFCLFQISRSQKA